MNLSCQKLENPKGLPSDFGEQIALHETTHDLLLHVCQKTLRPTAEMFSMLIIEIYLWLSFVITARHLAHSWTKSCAP